MLPSERPRRGLWCPRRLPNLELAPRISGVAAGVQFISIEVAVAVAIHTDADLAARGYERERQLGFHARGP